MWDVPPPGTTWTTPGSAPPPVAGPPGPGVTFPPPAGVAPGMPPPKQRAAHRTQVLAFVVCIGLAFAGLAALDAIGAVRDRADAVDGLTFDELLAMDAFEQDRVFQDLIEADDAVVDAVAPYLGLTVLTGIAWVLWQRRFVRNAMPFGHINGSLGWGTWGWFVPLANLYYPESQLAQAARLSDPTRLEREGGRGASPFVYLWWATWAGSSILAIGSNLSAPSGYELARGTADISDFQRADLTQGLAYGLAVAAASFGIATVLHSTRRQRAMLARLGVHA